MSLIMGVDLGTSGDYTAIVGVQRYAPSERFPRGCHVARYIERLQLGLSYAEILGHLGVLLRTPEMAGAGLAVDRTGVGQPVVDFLRAGLPSTSITAVVITGGETSRREGSTLFVPKGTLVDNTRIGFDSGQLRIAPRQPGADLLERELRRFIVRTHATSESYEAGSGHDDLVLAMSMAFWAFSRAAGFNWVDYLRSFPRDGERAETPLGDPDEPIVPTVIAPRQPERLPVARDYISGRPYRVVQPGGDEPVEPFELLTR